MPCSGDDVSRRAWIDAAQRVLAGERDGIACPVNDDADLMVDWVPFETEIGGEFRLACPRCGETNFVLVRGDSPTPARRVLESDEAESASEEGCASDG